MARMRRPIVFLDGFWQVDLPHLQMIPNTFLPVISNVSTSNGPLPNIAGDDNRLIGATVEVDVPDHLLNDQRSALDKEIVRRRYPRKPYNLNGS